MRLKLYRAASVAEAMAQVRAELGADALILSTRRLPVGVELTAALETEGAGRSEPLQNLLEAPHRPVETASELAFHGIPASLAARLTGPDLPGALRAALRFGMLPISGAGKPLMFVGMPGAGKTLSAARLATRLVLAGLSPLVITADGRRAGAAEELAAYTRLLGISLIAASTPRTLARALRDRPPDAPTLIDTSGINPFNAEELARVKALAGTAGAVPVLVMQAGQDPLEAAEQAVAFATVGAGHILPTRLDVARRLGSVLAAAAAADLVLTEAGIGSGAIDGLTPLTAEFLADRLARFPGPGTRPTPRRPDFPTTKRRFAKQTGKNGHIDDLC